MSKRQIQIIQLILLVFLTTIHMAQSGLDPIQWFVQLFTAPLAAFSAFFGWVNDFLIGPAGIFILCVALIFEFAILPMSRHYGWIRFKHNFITSICSTLIVLLIIRQFNILTF